MAQFCGARATACRSRAGANTAPADVHNNGSKAMPGQQSASQDRSGFRPSVSRPEVNNHLSRHVHQPQSFYQSGSTGAPV